MIRRRFLFLFLLGLGFIYSCRELSYIHRKQLMLLPLDMEINIGQTVYREELSKVTLCKDPGVVEGVRRVGYKIASVAVKDPEVEEIASRCDWEFNVIKNDQVINAFALPGGKVAFYTGILPICKGEDGIAVVMGHEIAHVLLRHEGERISHRILLRLGLTALSEGLKKKDPKVMDAIRAALGIGVVLPFSRKMESEADKVGLILMTKAGYNPRESVEFWKRMHRRSGRNPPEFLSTHPSYKKRIRNLERLIPEVEAKYSPGESQGQFELSVAKIYFTPNPVHRGHQGDMVIEYQIKGDIPRAGLPLQEARSIKFGDQPVGHTFNRVFTITRDTLKQGPLVTSKVRLQLPRGIAVGLYTFEVEVRAQGKTSTHLAYFRIIE